MCCSSQCEVGAVTDRRGASSGAASTQEIHIVLEKNGSPCFYCHCGPLSFFQSVAPSCSEKVVIRRLKPQCTEVTPFPFNNTMLSIRSPGPNRPAPWGQHGATVICSHSHLQLSLTSRRPSQLQVCISSPWRRGRTTHTRTHTQEAKLKDGCEERIST